MPLFRCMCKQRHMCANSCPFVDICMHACAHASRSASPHASLCACKRPSDTSPNTHASRLCPCTSLCVPAHGSLPQPRDASVYVSLCASICLNMPLSTSTGNMMPKTVGRTSRLHRWKFKFDDLFLAAELFRACFPQARRASAGTPHAQIKTPP